MEAETVLPKRLVAYIHDVGVRALDHLADTVEHNSAGTEGAVHSLVGHWRSMAEAEKQDFVDKVAAAVVEVVVASTLLPATLKLKKVAKSARKVIKKRSKALRKSVKALTAKTVKKGKKKAKKAAEAQA